MAERKYLPMAGVILVALLGFLYLKDKPSAVADSPPQPARNPSAVPEPPQPVRNGAAEVILAESLMLLRVQLDQLKAEHYAHQTQIDEFKRQIEELKKDNARLEAARAALQTGLIAVGSGQLKPGCVELCLGGNGAAGTPINRGENTVFIDGPKGCKVVVAEWVPCEGIQGLAQFAKLRVEPDRDRVRANVLLTTDAPTQLSIRVHFWYYEESPISLNR